MIEGLNLMAKNMKLYTFIRMIGDEESELIAKDIGIDAMSGNFLGKMMPIESIKKEQI
jgi:EAL domain-containing protein (putative c-di-GMP-specific phosphodiesterase class I)